MCPGAGKVGTGRWRMSIRDLKHLVAVTVVGFGACVREGPNREVIDRGGSKQECKMQMFRKLEL